MIYHTKVTESVYTQLYIMEYDHKPLCDYEIWEMKLQLGNNGEMWRR